MHRLRIFLLPALLALVLPVVLSAADSPFNGRWRLDRDRSTALDGWTDWDLVIHVAGSQVAFNYDMQWSSTKFSVSNEFDTAHPVTLPNFFRVEQRHMALYPAKGQSTPARAQWLDNHRTLRIEADAPVEISQGNTTMRIYAEYRLLEGDHELVLIELHSSRPRPLVYHFTKVSTEK